MTFFILSAVVALFRHSCRASSKWRYLPIDLSFWVPTIALVRKHDHKAILSLRFIWQTCVNGPVTDVSLFGLGNQSLQSRERLVFPPALCILLLLYPPTRVRLHYLFSHSFTSSNSPSLMVLSSQNINILKNLLSWKRMYPHFYIFLSALSPYFHGRITWTHIMYFLLHFLTSPLLLSPWQ